MGEAALATPAPETVTPAVETPAPVAEVKPISKEFQILAKKERMVQEEREKIKAERLAFEADRARVAELEAKYGSKPKSPREALERYGWSYADATKYELNDGEPTPEILSRKALEEIEAFKRDQAEQAKRQMEEATKHTEAQTQAVLSEFKQSIHDYVAKETDRHELINIFGAQDLVYDTIEAYFSTHGKVLSIPEGAELVEKYCEDIAKKYLTSKRFKSQTAPATPPAKTDKQENPSPLRQQRTLDNSLTPSTTPSLVSPKVENDRMKRALAALG